MSQLSPKRIGSDAACGGEQREQENKKRETNREEETAYEENGYGDCGDGDDYRDRDHGDLHAAGGLSGILRAMPASGDSSRRVRGRHWHTEQLPECGLAYPRSGRIQVLQNQLTGITSTMAGIMSAVGNIFR